MASEEILCSGLRLDFDSCIVFASADRLRGKVPIRDEAFDLRPRERLYVKNGHPFERIRQVAVGTRRNNEAGIVVLLDLTLDPQRDPLSGLSIIYFVKSIQEDEATSAIEFVLKPSRRNFETFWKRLADSVGKSELWHAALNISQVEQKRSAREHSAAPRTGQSQRDMFQQCGLAAARSTKDREVTEARTAHMPAPPDRACRWNDLEASWSF